MTYYCAAYNVTYLEQNCDLTLNLRSFYGEEKCRGQRTLPDGGRLRDESLRGCSESPAGRARGPLPGDAEDRASSTPRLAGDPP